MTAGQRLDELGLSLPPVAAPLAAYVPTVVVGHQVWTSGQLPLVEGALALTGKVGDPITLDQAAGQARVACLNAVAAVAAAAGGLDNIVRVLRVVVYVASAPGFTGQAKVANGASTLLGDIFGADGVHVRSAVGVAVLPLDACVEVELYCEI